MKNTNNVPEIKFVSYDGKYPALCCGTLVLSVDGEERSFDSDERFWESTGFCYEGMTVMDSRPWEIIPEDMPEDLRSYAKEIEDVFNQNVPFGCCGGCLN